MYRFGWLLVAGLAIGGCGGNKSSGDSSVYIALPSDFGPFRTWTRTFLGDQPLQGHPPGPRYGYVKEPPGATEYPVGAIVVKTVERDATPQDWDLFGMVKRGGGYNAAGAANWEFFTLKINAANVPVVADRGENPIDADADGGVGSGYTDPSGSGVTCNRCHGVPGTERSDHILSALLAPGAK